MIVFVLLAQLAELHASSDWVRRLLSTPGHQHLFQLPPSFTEDPVTANAVLEDIRQVVDSNDPHTSAVVENAVLLIYGKVKNARADTESEVSEIETMARKIYGLYHARYCTTNEGLRAIKAMFDKSAYGVCQRVNCDRFPLLPVGLDDDPGLSTMKCFCGKCRDLYESQLHDQRQLDGSYFGTSLPHIFLQRYVRLAPSRSTASYTPRIFGIEISPMALEMKKFHAIPNCTTELMLSEEQSRAEAISAQSCINTNI